MSIRRPAVAGQFYPSDPAELADTLDACFMHPLGPGKLPPAPKSRAQISAVVSPHAGYAYSGPVAAHSYLHVSSLRDPDLIVVVAPNHYGVGSSVSSFREGYWETPLGRMKVDQGAARALAESTEQVVFDPDAHKIEHSLEVQVPFLQRVYGDAVPFLPVSLLLQDIETAKAVSRGIVKAIGGKKAVLVGSSDLTHYEPAERARNKDMALLGQVLRMDLEGFYSTIDSLGVTACGFGAIATVMEAARSLGLSSPELLKYATSGDITGDNLQVVGYAALRFV